MKVPLNIDFVQILLHLFNFALLFAGLYFLLYKPVKKFMEKRRQEYADMDAKSAQALSEAEALKKEYESKLKDCDTEIAEKKNIAYHEIDEAKARCEKEQKQEASEIIANAYKKAEAEKARIINSANEEITKMIADATEKIALGSGKSFEAYDSFLDATKGDENRG